MKEEEEVKGEEGRRREKGLEINQLDKAGNLTLGVYFWNSPRGYSIYIYESAIEAQVFLFCLRGSYLSCFCIFFAAAVAGADKDTHAKEELRSQQYLIPRL